METVNISQRSERTQKKATVLFIGPYPPPFSGPELGMKLFLDSSLAHVFKIYFLKTNFRKSNEYKGRFDIWMMGAFFRFIIMLTFVLVRYRPAVAYYPVTPTQIGWIGRDLWCLNICRIFGVKTIIHLRGGHFKINFQRFSKLVKKIIAMSCRSVSLGLVQAECLRDQFEGILPDHKIHVLYNAVDSDEYRNDAVHDYNPNQILFLGHMTKAKGYCDLVRAIPIVAEKYPDIQFCFAGTMRKGERGVFFNQATGDSINYEDPFRTQDTIISSKHAGNYINLGVVSGGKKIETIRRTNIFVLPSYSEGFSRSLLEAMSMGKPVVCTPVGAHRDVVKDGVNGFIVPPGDIKQIAGKIVTLLDDAGLRDRIAEENYQYVRNNYDISIIAQQMEDYINRVIQ